MKTILASAEHELRTTGTLSDATCAAFAQNDDQAKRGFEAAFAFLGCQAATSSGSDTPVPQDDRVAAIQLMLIRLRAHTDDPRWSSHVLDSMFNAALRPPGAAIGDILHALFRIFAECSSALSDAQAHFIRELGVRIVGVHRRAYTQADLSWMATVFTGPGPDASAAQAYLAAYTLPVSLVPQARESILRALRSTRFAEEVRRDLED